MSQENKTLIKPTNLIKLRGTIIGMRSTTKMTSFVIITDGGEKKGSTVVNILFFEPLKDTFKVKEHVDIIAHMQSKIVKKEDNKNKFYQIVVGDKIKHTNRMLADYIPLPEFQTTEGGIPDDINKAFIYGKISRIYKPNDAYAVVTVTVPSAENKVNYIDIICYKRQAQLALNLTEGDFIVATGEIRSAKERPKADEIFWQNVICKDIAKISDEQADLSIYAN